MPLPTLKDLCINSIFNQSVRVPANYLTKDLEKELAIEGVFRMNDWLRYWLALKNEDFARFIFSNNRLYTIFGDYSSGLKTWKKYVELDFFSPHLSVEDFYDTSKLEGILDAHPSIKKEFLASAKLKKTLPPGYLEKQEPKNIGLGCIR